MYSRNGPYIEAPETGGGPGGGRLGGGGGGGAIFGENKFLPVPLWLVYRNRKRENSWLLAPYSIKANHFCELKRQTFEPCSLQK